MASVPYTPYATAAPSEGNTPKVSINTPIAAFGGNIAEAIGHLGKTVEGAGNELFARAIALQQLNNETEAKEADAKYMLGAGELHAKYSAMQGKEAVDAYPKYSEDLQKLRTDIRGGLSNDMARKMYDGSSLSTMGRSIFNGAGHAATQNKLWAIGNSKALLDLDAKTVEDDPQDPRLFAEKLERTKANAAELASLQGFGSDSPQAQDLALKATSKLRSQQIIGLSRTDPFGAATQLDKFKTELTQDDYLKTDNTVRAQGRAVGSVNIANEVYKPDLPLKDMEDAARARANKLDPNDPLLAQHAVAAVQGKYNQDKYAKSREDHDNLQIVDGGIQAGVKDIQQLRINPRVAAAIDALPKDKQLAIPGAINRYNSAKNKTTNEDNAQKLYGMSNNDVEQFLNTDVTKEQLSQGDMMKFQKLQQKLKDNPNQDPRVDRAKSWIRGAMGSQLEALGIYGRTTANKDDYDHYTGALQSALDVWQQSHGKPATYKDVVNDIAPQILQRRAEPGAIFGSVWPNQKPFFTQEVPAKWSENLKADVVAKGGVEPTEEQIYRAYVRSQLIDLYEKKATPK